MMMKRMTLLLIALSVGVSAAWAQAKPDLSGTWNLSGTNPPNYPGLSGVGRAVTNDCRSNRDRPRSRSRAGNTAPRQMTVVYKLDGSDTIWDAPSMTQSGTTAIVKWRTKARWDGNKLILFTWNTALNQMRDVLSVSNGALTHTVRGTEQPGPSTNATLTYTRGR